MLVKINLEVIEMKKIVSIIILFLLVGSGVIYLFNNHLALGIGVTNEEMKMSQKMEEQTNIKAKIHSRNVLLQNLNTGEILIEKNKDEKVAIASLTKLMTVYLLLNSEKDLNQEVMMEQKIVDKLVNEGASLSGYLPGDNLTIKDLAYGIVLPSGGDASITAANHVSGSEKKFIELMNQEAETIGMKNTHFKNATGLDAGNHYSTVSDLQLFMMEALKNQQFKEIMLTTTYQTAVTPYSPQGYYLESTLLKDTPELTISNGKILGGKTGYTEKAGQCLISLAEVNKTPYLLITTGAGGNPLTEQLNMTDARLLYQSIGNS